MKIEIYKIVIVIIVIILLSNINRVKKEYEKKEGLSVEIGKQRKREKEEEENYNNIRENKKKLDELEKEYKNNINKVVYTDEIHGNVLEIFKLCEGIDIEIKNTEIEKKSLENGYVEVKLVGNYKGSYDDTKRFIREVMEMDKLAIIKSIKMSTKNRIEKNYVNSDVTIAFITIEGESRYKENRLEEAKDKEYNPFYYGDEDIE